MSHLDSALLEDPFTMRKLGRGNLGWLLSGGCCMAAQPPGREAPLLPRVPERSRSVPLLGSAPFLHIP